MTAPAQPSLWSDPDADALWLRDQLSRRGWRPGQITEPNTLSITRLFPDRAQALTVWETIAAGKTYRPKGDA